MPLSSRDGGEKRRGLKNSEKSKGEGRGGKRREEEGRGEECVGVCGDIGRKDCMMGIFKEE